MSCGNSRSSKCNPCGPSEAAMNEIANKAAYYARIAQYASDGFSQVYLGAKDVAPTTDNTGNPLIVGALYFNTVSDILYVWDGSVWDVATNFNETTPFLSTGSTTARTLANRFADVVNVKDFGAVGDGVTDDTAALRLSWIEAKNTSKALYIPSGTYLVTNLESVIVDSGDLGGLIVYGDGDKLSLLKRKYAYRTDFNPTQISDFGAYAASGRFFDFTGGCSNLEIKDIGFIGYNSGPTDPNLPIGYTNHYSYYNNSSVCIYVATSIANSIKNLKFSNIYSYKGFSSLSIEDLTSTAENISISNIDRQGGYHSIDVLGGKNINISDCSIKSLEGNNSTWEILRGIYFSSSDSNINNITINGSAATGIFVRSYAPFNVENISICNANITSFGSGIIIQAKTDSTIKSVNVNNVSVKTTTQNPQGGIAFATDGPAPTNTIIENINISNIATSGAGKGFYFSSEASGNTAVMDGINISNVTAEADLCNNWFSNGSSIHSTLPSLIKNFSMKNVSIVTLTGSIYGNIYLDNFVDSSIKNITSNSISPITIGQNKRLCIFGNFIADPATSGANYPILINGMAYPEGKILYSNSTLSTVDAVVGSNPAIKMSAQDMYDWISFLQDNQNHNSIHFTNSVVSFNCTGTFTIPYTSRSFSGVKFIGGTFTAFNSDSLLCVEFNGCTFTGTQNHTTPNLVYYVSCTFNVSGQTALYVNNGNIDCSDSSFTALTALYVTGIGGRAFSAFNTGSSTTAYNATNGSTIVRRAADTLTGSSTTSQGGIIQTY